MGALDRIVAAIATGKPVSALATAPDTSINFPPLNRGPARTNGALAALTRRVEQKAAKHLDIVLKRAPVWQVAFRKTNARTLPGQPLSPHYWRLPDDGQRYFADPFVVVHEGVHHVFVEEFPFATQRGVISHFTVGGDGKASPPRVVLKQPHHLSYPQVFRHEGKFWMLPEASASGRLDLYRAERFPDGWVKHATLIEAPLHDATFSQHEGRFWITAAIALGGPSGWDTLSIYSADRLEGPWHPHPANPVLVDARSARPAGQPFVHDGALWRPAQDCTRGYGGALSFNRVTRLDEVGFAQELASTLHFGRREAAAGPHTINYADGLEVIDLFTPPARKG